MNNNFDPNQQAPQQVEYQAPLYEQKPAIDPKPILIMAIIGLWLGCIPGIILCAIALNKAKAYIAAGNELTGVAKVGNILAKVGLIVGIVTTVIVAIYMIVIIIAAIASAAVSTPSYGGSYYYPYY